MNVSLTEPFIAKYKDILVWRSIITYHNLSEDFIEQNSDYIDWSYLTSKQKLSENFIIKHSDKLNWNQMAYYQDLSESFIEQCADKLNWSSISSHQKLSNDFILKHKDKLNWGTICYNQDIPKDFMEQHIISEQFVKKTKSAVLSGILESGKQSFSEQSLKLFLKKGKTVRKMISKKSPLSKDFVLKYFDKLDTYCLLYINTNIDNDIREEVRLINQLSGG
jgi:hypothetical protein